jgi:hypothetical protein
MDLSLDSCDPAFQQTTSSTDLVTQVASPKNIGRAATLAAVAVLLVLQTMTAARAAAPAKKLVLTGTVTSIFQIDAQPPSRRNWGVTIRVDKVKVGKYAEPEFTFAIHSPARAGLKIGHRYTVEATWDGQEYLVQETVSMKEEAAQP